MKYPVPKDSRVKLLKYYYELCIVPTESHVVNERVKMFSALLPHKYDSVMSLDTKDIVLDWRPLWRILKKELWPTTSIADPSYVLLPFFFHCLDSLSHGSRNVANVYLHLAELSKRFFPVSEVKEILGAILPLLGPDVSIRALTNEQPVDLHYRLFLAQFRSLLVSSRFHDHRIICPFSSRFGNRSILV